MKLNHERYIEDLSNENDKDLEYICATLLLSSFDIAQDDRVELTYVSKLFSIIFISNMSKEI